MKKGHIKIPYLEHIEDVKKNVPVEKLLMMELDDGWEKLCAFLEKRRASVPYPFTHTIEMFQVIFYAYG